MSLTPQFGSLIPSQTQQLLSTNYLQFNAAGAGGATFAQQYLPEIYEQEVERYGNRTLSGFLKMVGAEMPLQSDQVIWSEQGRLHVAYDAAESGANTVQVTTAASNTILLPANHNVQLHDTVIISNAASTSVLKCLVIDLAGTGNINVTVQPYTQANLGTNSSFADGDDIKLFVYGTEYRKGSSQITGSLDASFTQFSNRPIIMRDRYQVNGSDTAQIGWVEVTSENGASGYLWYLKSEHEARLRFEDYLEMSMIEAEQVASSSTISGVQGSEGLFAAINSRGLVFTGTDFDVQLNYAAADGGAGSASSYVAQSGLSEFDSILQELDKQGAIEENMMFLDRNTSLEIDNMLASVNAHVAGGASYGVFNNAEDMALNLGFSGFRRGSYDFYKSDWKYLNDSTTRGNLVDIQGMLVPAGTSTVYDQSMGKNISRPFLHVRYRSSEADDRKMKSWITGSVGGNYTSDADEMVVNFLSERCLCVQAANNFVLFKA